MRSIRVLVSVASLFATFAAQADQELGLGGLSDLSKALLSNPKNKAWVETRWKGAAPHVMAKSLLFDQESDRTSYRPIPLSIDNFPQNSATPAQLIEKKPRIASTQPLSAFRGVARSLAFSPKLEKALDQAVAVKATPKTPSIVVVEKAPSPMTAPQPPVSRVLAAPVATPAPIAPIAVVAKSAPKKKSKARSRFELGDARLIVLSEDGMLGGEKAEPIEGAVIEWVGPGSGLRSRTDGEGITRIPYPLALSTRFLVRAPGYLPATGYAIAGLEQKVLMIREERMPAIVKSLGIVPEPSKRIVVGKVIDRRGKPLAGVTIDANVNKPFRSYYSMGSFGLFHNAALATGPQGEFLITGIDEGIQYLMPTVNLAKSLKDVTEAEDSANQEWPASIVDFSGLPQVVTVTIAESALSPVESQVVDAFGLERPESAIHVTVGGQRGVHVPDEDGDLRIRDLSLRGSVDLVEVRSQGYLKTWINALPRSATFPTAISIFTWAQLERMFSRENIVVNFSRGLVMGHLGLERYRSPTEIAVYDGRGRRKTDAKILYFDADNEVRATMAATDRNVQSFAATNLGPGEWHLVAKDQKSGEGLAIQVIRVDGETVTQVEF